MLRKLGIPAGASLILVLVACTGPAPSGTAPVVAPSAAIPLLGVWTPGPLTVARWTQEGNGTIAFHFRPDGTVSARRVNGEEVALTRTPGQPPSDAGGRWTGQMVVTGGTVVSYALTCPALAAGSERRIVCRTDVRNNFTGSSTVNDRLVLRPQGDPWPSGREG